MWWQVGVGRQGRRAGLFGDYRFEWKRNLQKERKVNG